MPSPDVRITTRMKRSSTCLLLVALLLAGCGGASDTASEAPAADPATADPVAEDAVAEDAVAEDTEAAVALEGFCEDMGAWLAAFREYQQVEAGSPEEAAAVEEMERLNPLIADRVDIPELVDALETITADARAAVDGAEPTADQAALESSAELIGNILTNCE
jgi:hypothetical protein